MDKKTAARILDEIGSLLELKGENTFKVRAYTEGAKAVECLDGDLEGAVRTGRIATIKGIGKGLQAELAELVETGTSRQLQQLHAAYPSGVREMLGIPGIGPKKIKLLFEELGIGSIDALEEAAQADRLSAIKGFGTKTQDKILKNIAFYRTNIGKHRYIDAIGSAMEILDEVKAIPGVERAEIAGSLRRKREVVKDIDLLAASPVAMPVMDAFAAFGSVADIVGKGPTKTSVRLGGGLGVDLRVVTPEQYPFALVHFTGSAEHNTLLRGRAKTMGLKLNEYGLFRASDDTLVSCKDETEVYAALGLAWIPPELREGADEVILAASGRVPALVEIGQIRGVFHAHTVMSDGHATLAQMAEAARALGLQYLGISDHTKAAAYANGLDDKRVKAQHIEIDALNAGFGDFTILKGVEADILRDGGIDLEPGTLEACDFVIASIHSRFAETSDEMTERICIALANPRVTILGHMTGRLLLEREPYALDYDRIFAAAAAHGVIIEINANPSRLDVDWRFIRKAKAAGLLFCINPDAHSTDALSHTQYGVNVARKGGLGPSDILNTRPLSEIRAYLERRRVSAQEPNPSAGRFLVIE